MNYQEQLAQPEWQKKREEILERDNYSCCSCGKKRSEFRKLVPFKDFEEDVYFCNVGQLRSIGYGISSNLDEDGNIMLIKANWLSFASCIGEKRKFEDDKIIFCQKFDSNDSKRRPSLYFFYQDTLQVQGRVDLNIHHKYYIKNKKAWEYKNQALITLCSECHQKIHNNEVVYVYSSDPTVNVDQDKKIEFYATEICGRCNGAGILPEFYYWQEGICFGCGGEGVIGIEE